MPISVMSWSGIDDITGANSPYIILSLLLRDETLFFISFFVKILFGSCKKLAEKNCLLQGYEGKELSAKQREMENFLKYIDISKFWHKLD